MTDLDLSPEQHADVQSISRVYDPEVLFEAAITRAVRALDQAKDENADEAVMAWQDVIAELEGVRATFSVALVEED